MRLNMALPSPFKPPQTRQPETDMQTPSPALSGDTCNADQQWVHVHEDGWLNAVKERMDTGRGDTTGCISLDKTAVHCPLKIKIFPCLEQWETGCWSW